MYTYNDWHLMRGLVLLAVFGLLMLYAFLAGAWQARKARRDAMRMIEQVPPVAQGTSRSAESRVAARQPAPQQEANLAGTARHAA